ncbi:GUN4 domain-containing protein [Anabaena catenula]|uniref:GUN4 domain-containing protein n=1 Tax=Anabaena catenula FACHB-362 TaxID=2692877 RepID=A0ABR8IX14_9NOST|nr:GUN4 domain-containing protein [Anabaena catenula]MBD2690609.1 GUN4 domain-containing protein [Anabaena catenula FACHB-362]
MVRQDRDRFQPKAETVSAILLSGLEKIQRCLLSVAMGWGKVGIRLVICALNDPNPNIEQTAVDLLRHRSEPEVQRAIWNYLNLPQPSTLLDYKTLQRCLAVAQWQSADEITCAIILAMAERQGSWLREVDIPKLVVADLGIVDQLWRFYSSDRFGFTVQAQIWQTCEQEECSKIDYSTSDITYCFGKRVGWKVQYYTERDYSDKYDFERNAKIPYDLTAPVGNLPSTFALGGGENHLEFEHGDTESTMGFYAPSYSYYTWSKDSLFGQDFLRQFFPIIEMLRDRRNQN